MPLQSVKGFKDALPPESELASWFEQKARGVLRLYGFREIRLPTLELEELFVKSTGETTDIVEKEMFHLEDAGGRKLALRPEGTPGVVRAYIQHHLQQQGKRCKLFYCGSMFRAERPQAGRLREFTQIGAECFGNAHPAADAELIAALAEIYNECGLQDRYHLRLNNLGCERPECRPSYRARLLDFLRTMESELCENCRKRIARNPLRVLDCKGDGPKLASKPNRPLLEPCAACLRHFEQMVSLLRSAKPGRTDLPGAPPMPDWKTDSSLVRGLDYYTRTVFEFSSNDLGAQDALAGGGRYDGLVKSMGGPDVPAVGWALGVERGLMAVEAAKKGPKDTQLRIYVAVQEPEGRPTETAMALLNALRRKLKSPGLLIEGGMFGDSLKHQMSEADRLGAHYAVIIAERELAQEECIVKDMKGGEQAKVKLGKDFDGVIGWLRKRLNEGAQAP